MSGPLLKYYLCGLFLISLSNSFAQSQICPANINFASGTLDHWKAYIGNNAMPTGNGPGAIKQVFDSTVAAPTGTIGATAIGEYQLPSVNGIQVLTTPGIDPFGGFNTIPTINGYAYNYSILLGSTAVRRGGGGGTGGYIRGISYSIKVPPGPPGEPYTITYAYAMVLENGSHTTSNQPMFTATVTTTDSVFRCASAMYNLPTRFVGIGYNTRGGVDSLFEMDEGIAAALGFSLSPNPSPNDNGNGNENRMRVWTQGWKEVTFDLAPYRGKTVSLTFEADNCIPGGHFSYAYIALRNMCEGLVISGFPEACVNTVNTYSIPALAGAVYNWEVPTGWNVVSGNNSNILQVIPNSNGGRIIAHEMNGCANLRDTIMVITRPATVGGHVHDDHTVCEGTNITPLNLSGQTGDVLNWLVSTNNGSSWEVITATSGTTNYTAENLSTTSLYRALVQNGQSCNIDTSSAATITVDPKSEGGRLTPTNMPFCLGQFKDALLTLKDRVGLIQNWQLSQQPDVWNNFTPPHTDTAYNVLDITSTTQYRVIVKSGVCPADTSLTARVNFINTAFPQATSGPLDSTICYGDTARLHSAIEIGTSYAWTSVNSILNNSKGTISSNPFSLSTEARPLQTTKYILSIVNEGCPNPLRDTLQVNVLSQVIVDAGRDTAIVHNQPLQLQAFSNYTEGEGVSYEWTPTNGLSNTNISNPIATLGTTIDSMRYTVKVTNTAGCFGTDDILVKVFKTLPDIFVPNAFTPGKAENGRFRPIPVGIAQVDYFRVFNRWGQLVYASADSRQGWDGTINGQEQGSGTYVWMVQGKDYTGKIITKKGTVVLIR